MDAILLMQKPPPFANTVFASWVWRASHAFKQALPGLNKAGGWGGQPPPFANTVLASWVWKGLACSQAQCSHHGFGRASHALKRALPGLKQAGGVGGGGGAAPPICKHSARIMGLEGLAKKSGGVGGRSPPPICKEREGGSGTTKWKEADLTPYEGRLPRPPISEREGGLERHASIWEGPRMLSSTVLASWVFWKGLACFEASVARLKKKKKAGGVGGGLGGGGAPICKHSARIMGLEGLACFQASVARLKRSGGGGGVGGGAQPL